MYILYRESQSRDLEREGKKCEERYSKVGFLGGKNRERNWEKRKGEREKEKEEKKLLNVVMPQICMIKQRYSVVDETINTVGCVRSLCRCILWKKKKFIANCRAEFIGFGRDYQTRADWI